MFKMKVQTMFCSVLLFTNHSKSLHTSTKYTQKKVKKLTKEVMLLQKRADTRGVGISNMKKSTVFTRTIRASNNSRCSFLARNNLNNSRCAASIINFF